MGAEHPSKFRKANNNNAYADQNLKEPLYQRLSQLIIRKQNSDNGFFYFSLSSLHSIDPHRLQTKTDMRFPLEVLLLRAILRLSG